MLDDRKLEVLRAIVTDYVASREPVGSKALVERHQLGVSPAPPGRCPGICCLFAAGHQHPEGGVAQC